MFNVNWSANSLLRKRYSQQFRGTRPDQGGPIEVSAKPRAVRHRTSLDDGATMFLWYPHVTVTDLSNETDYLYLMPFDNEGEALAAAASIAGWELQQMKTNLETAMKRVEEMLKGASGGKTGSDDLGGIRAGLAEASQALPAPPT